MRGGAPPVTAVAYSRLSGTPNHEPLTTRHYDRGMMKVNHSRLRFGLIVAGILTLYAGLTEGILRPQHANGLAQPVTGRLIALDDFLQTVGRGISLATVGRAGTPPLVRWFVATSVNAVVALFLATALRRPPPNEEAPQRSRREFLRCGLQLAVGGGAAATGYAVLVEPRRYTVTSQEIPLPGLPLSLDGLRVVQLTDIHHGPWLDLPYVQRVVDAANALEPDLVLLTGDYIHRSSAYVRPVLEELSRLRPTIGTVAVLGNHDRWDGGRTLSRAFAEANLPLIDNDRRILTPDRQLVTDASAGLALCGVGDLWTDHQNYQRALGELPEAMPRLLLSHNPDVAEEPGLVESGLRVDLMVSGHTHGGQVRVPGMGTPWVPSRFGQKYAQGLVQGPVCPVFICRGVGLSLFPVRFGVCPEVALLRLRSASERT